MATGNVPNSPILSLDTISYYSLAANRTTIWNPGLMSKGGIPSANWTVYNATPLAPSGGSDDSAAINKLLAAAPANSVVQLAAGTFLMGSGLYVSLTQANVVLRGAGAGVTILKNPRNLPATTSNQAPTDTTPIVIIGPGRWVNPDGDARCQGVTAYQPQYMQLLAVDGVKGSYSITVANGAIYSANQMVLLDETSRASWQPDRAGIANSIWASSDYVVTWQCHTPASIIDDPLATGITPNVKNNYAGTGTGSDAACWFCRQDRPQNEIKQVANVSGNTITFTSPLHKNYRVNNYAELTTYTGGNAPVTYAGIENLTMVGGGDGCLRFESTMYCWGKNVEVTEWYDEGVAIDYSFRTEFRDSYIHDACWAEPGGAGYSLSIGEGSSEVLIENNIIRVCNKVIVARSSGTASVVAYNYMDDGYIATDESWVELGLNASHMVGPHMVLFEGNQSFNMDSDDTHGNSTYIVYFRNHTTGVRAKFTSDYTGDVIDDANNIPGGTTAPNGPIRCAAVTTYGYYMSFVGNVLGIQNVSTANNKYVYQANTPGVWGPSIWLLGWNDISPYEIDPQVGVTSIRDGNWDWYNSQQSWINSGTPAVIPDSLFYTSKPAWWGANTWPWVDPTTGTTYTLPAKARWDANIPNG